MWQLFYQTDSPLIIVLGWLVVSLLLILQVSQLPLWMRYYRFRKGDWWEYVISTSCGLLGMIGAVLLLRSPGAPDAVMRTIILVGLLAAQAAARMGARATRELRREAESETKTKA